MTIASWLPDPFHRHELRWWDGQQWTDHVSDHGVAGLDPHHEAPPGASAWGPPTLPPPRPTASPAPTATAHRRRTSFAIAAVAVVAALVVGGVVLLGGDDEAASPTTVATTVASIPASTTTSTVAPTTVPSFDDLDLMAALPGSGDVPAGWSQYTASTHQHDPDADSGICLGPNSSSLAVTTGSTAGADGPTFDLPDGGWFGIEAYAFPDDETAAAFMLATVDQAACSEPVTWQVEETWLDVFRDGYGDDAVWDLSEVAAAERRGDTPDGMLVDVTMRDRATTEVEGSVYTYRFDELVRYEQYGPVVIIYWLDGQYDFEGFTSTPDWLYEPTVDALLDAVGEVRVGIRAALAG